MVSKKSRSLAIGLGIVSTLALATVPAKAQIQVTGGSVTGNAAYFVPELATQGISPFDLQVQSLTIESPNGTLTNPAFVPTALGGFTDADGSNTVNNGDTGLIRGRLSGIGFDENGFVIPFSQVDTILGYNINTFNSDATIGGSLLTVDSSQYFLSNLYGSAGSVLVPGSMEIGALDANLETGLISLPNTIQFSGGGSNLVTTESDLLSKVTFEFAGTDAQVTESTTADNVDGSTQDANNNNIQLLGETTSFTITSETGETTLTLNGTNGTVDFRLSNGTLKDAATTTVAGDGFNSAEKVTYSITGQGTGIFGFLNSTGANFAGSAKETDSQSVTYDISQNYTTTPSSITQTQETVTTTNPDGTTSTVVTVVDATGTTITTTDSTGTSVVNDTTVLDPTLTTQTNTFEAKGELYGDIDIALAVGQTFDPTATSVTSFAEAQSNVVSTSNLQSAAATYTQINVQNVINVGNYSFNFSNNTIDLSSIFNDDGTATDEVLDDSDVEQEIFFKDLVNSILDELELSGFVTAFSTEIGGSDTTYELLNAPLFSFVFTSGRRGRGRVKVRLVQRGGDRYVLALRGGSRRLRARRGRRRGRRDLGVAIGGVKFIGPSSRIFPTLVGTQDLTPEQIQAVYDELNAEEGDIDDDTSVDDTDDTDVDDDGDDTDVDSDDDGDDTDVDGDDDDDDTETGDDDDDDTETGDDDDDDTETGDSSDGTTDGDVQIFQGLPTLDNQLQ